MGIALFLVLAAGLALAVTWGHRYNERRARFFLKAIEGRFRPESIEYAVIGRGLAYGFDMHLAGPTPEVQGVLTLLPRYTPLYLPIARLLGRQDLVKLTFHCRDRLSAGVGVVVHTSCKGSCWSAVEIDADWREEQIEHEGESYTLYFFNPSIAERLRSSIPKIRSVERLNQFSIDSRTQKITIFVTPDPQFFYNDLEKLIDFVFSLTGT